MIDHLSDLHFFGEGDFLARGPTPLPVVCASRPLFEHVVRQQVADRDPVTVRDGCHVTDYVTDASGTAVTGVRVRGDEDATQALEADLVVDATGRTSRTPAWLDRHGYDSPPVDEVRIDAAYSSVRIERPPAERRAFVLVPSPPLGRGCFVFPIEDAQWIVALTGVHGDHPPVERDAFLEFAGTLPFDAIARLLARNPWVTETIHHHPFPTHRRHRYESLDRFPDDFVVIGDAIVSFNPVYGQGMSVAALQALVLHHVLASGGPDDLGPRFFDHVPAVVEPPWRLAVGSDFRFEETVGPKPTGTDLVNRYLARL